jgi:hypothetical protein
MVRRIKDNVAVNGTWYSRGMSADEVGEAASEIGDHNWVDDGVGEPAPETAGAEVDASSTMSASAPASPAPAAKDGPERPPEHGHGATAQAWRDYAGAVGIKIPDDASRGDVIAAVQKYEAAAG